MNVRLSLSKKEHAKDIIFINCYRAPDNKTISSRDKAIDLIIENIKKIENYHKKYIVLTGDLNLDFSSNIDSKVVIADNVDEINNVTNDNVSTQEDNTGTKPSDYIDKLCSEFGLTNLIDKKTCIRENSASIIDLLLTNLNNICMVGVLEYCHFDHRPVFCIKRRSHDSRDNDFAYIRPFKDINTDVLYEELDNVNWESLKNDDINVYWRNIKN